MISVDQPSFPTLEKKLPQFLSRQLRGLSLETMSATDNKVSLQYQFRRQSKFDWVAFQNELNQLSGTAKVEIFIG